MASAPLASLPSSVPFFLSVANGQRFCLYHAPPAAVRIRGAVLYAHPFGEEMNRSRRIVALQARAFAAAGFAVLQIDLHGCGDSSGDFADARWNDWKNDIAAAHAWLLAKMDTPVVLWGLRLGALLLLDYARQACHPVDRFILWQPVMQGKTWLTQWLRLRLAGDMLSGDRHQHQNNAEGQNTSGGTQALRATLAQGQSLEIGGYELAPELAAAIDAVDGLALAPTLPPVKQEVDWFDIVASADKPMLPASSKIIAHWQAGELGRIRHHQVVAQAFWALPEITACPTLIDATLAAFSNGGP